MEKTEFTIEKSKVECYKIRHPKTGMYWADITIDTPGEKRGRIMIASDYGDWQYYWGSVGGGFKDFLCHINIGYVAGKFGADRHFDKLTTIKSMKKQVIDLRRDNDINSETARNIWQDIESLEDYDTAQIFGLMAFNSTYLSETFDCGPDLVYDYTPQFRKFWETIWPVFIDQLKQEIEAEKLTPQPN